MKLLISAIKDSVSRKNRKWFPLISRKELGSLLTTQRVSQFEGLLPNSNRRSHTKQFQPLINSRFIEIVKMEKTKKFRNIKRSVQTQIVCASVPLKQIGAKTINRRRLRVCLAWKTTRSQQIHRCTSISKSKARYHIFLALHHTFVLFFLAFQVNMSHDWRFSRW